MSRKRKPDLVTDITTEASPEREEFGADDGAILSTGDAPDGGIPPEMVQQIQTDEIARTIIAQESDKAACWEIHKWNYVNNRYAYTGRKLPLADWLDKGPDYLAGAMGPGEYLLKLRRRNGTVGPSFKYDVDALAAAEARGNQSQQNPLANIENMRQMLQPDNRPDMGGIAAIMTAVAPVIAEFVRSSNERNMMMMKMMMDKPREDGLQLMLIKQLMDQKSSSDPMSFLRTMTEQGFIKKPGEQEGIFGGLEKLIPLALPLLFGGKSPFEGLPELSEAQPSQPIKRQAPRTLEPVKDGKNKSELVSKLRLLIPDILKYLEAGVSAEELGNQVKQNIAETPIFATVQEILSDSEWESLVLESCAGAKNRMDDIRKIRQILIE